MGKSLLIIYNVFIEGKTELFPNHFSYASSVFYDKINPPDFFDKDEKPNRLSAFKKDVCFSHEEGFVSYPESRPIKNRILRATKGASIEEIINFKLLMKKTQFTEQQIVAMLKQHEQGLRAVDIARANGISEKTLYRWKSKYGGMDIKELKRVKELEAENSKLKRMYADLALMNEALKDVIEKKF